MKKNYQHVKLPTCHIHGIQTENLLVCDFPELHAEAIADSPGNVVQGSNLDLGYKINDAIFYFPQQSTHHLYYTSSTKRNQKDPKGWCILSLTSTPWIEEENIQKNPHDNFRSPFSIKNPLLVESATHVKASRRASFFEDELLGSGGHDWSHVGESSIKTLKCLGVSLV